MDFPGAAGAVLALYLAVLFQALGQTPSDTTRHTPFLSGLTYSDTRHGDRLTIAQIAGIQLSGLGGGTLAVLQTGDALVAAALAYLAVLVGIRSTMFAIGLVNRGCAIRKQELILDGAFYAPFVFAAAVLALVQAIP